MSLLVLVMEAGTFKVEALHSVLRSVALKGIVGL